MKNFLGVFGHTAVDVILRVDTLPEPNSSIAVENKVTRFGGTGANIAKAASDLGVDTKLASFVGDDFDEDYRKELEESGVDTSDLLEIEGMRTPTCWIVSDRNEDQMAFIDQGAMENAPEFDIQNRAIEDSEVVHIGTGRPEYYEKIVELASDMNKTICFDPAQELKYIYTSDIFEKLLSKTEYFFCNEEELKVAKRYLGCSETDDLLDHVEVVIVTKGSEGSALHRSEGVDRIPAYEPENILDPTGAGDAYRAGFYAGLSRGYDLKGCCYIASARASFAVEYHGPQEASIGWEVVKERIMEQDLGDSAVID